MVYTIVYWVYSFVIETFYKEVRVLRESRLGFIIALLFLGGFTMFHVCPWHVIMWILTVILWLVVSLYHRSLQVKKVLIRFFLWFIIKLKCYRAKKEENVDNPKSIQPESKPTTYCRQSQCRIPAVAIDPWSSPTVAIDSLSSPRSWSPLSPPPPTQPPLTSQTRHCSPPAQVNKNCQCIISTVGVPHGRKHRERGRNWSRLPTVVMTVSNTSATTGQTV